MICLFCVNSFMLFLLLTHFTVGRVYFIHINNVIIFISDKPSPFNYNLEPPIEYMFKLQAYIQGILENKLAVKKLGYEKGFYTENVFTIFFNVIN